MLLPTPIASGATSPSGSPAWETCSLPSLAATASMNKGDGRFTRWRRPRLEENEILTFSMYYPLAPDARLYRLTGPQVAWPTPVLGQGAYFTHGGRFNRAGQATVYCSEDPIVVI